MLSPANVMSATALFVALGGTAYATGVLPNGSVGTEQLRYHAATGTKIASDAITTSKVKDGSLRARDFKPGELPKGKDGAPGAAGAQGEKGETGPAGPVGPKGGAGTAGAKGDPGEAGPTGPKGDTGTTGTSGFAANTDGSIIAVVLGGTDVPLPNAQDFGSGITINGSSTTLTVADAGRYRISYRVRATVSLLMASRVLINGTGRPVLVDAPNVSTDRWDGDAIVSLTAGSTLGLQVYGLVGAITLAGGAAGASLAVERLS